MRAAITTFLTQNLIPRMISASARANNNAMWQQILQPMAKKRGSGAMTMLWVVGLGIIAFAVARNFNTKEIRNKMVQPLTNFFPKRASQQKPDQPAFYDGKAVNDVEIIESTLKKEV